jgi:hypothetical protein
MMCIPREEGKELLKEIHFEVCGNHAASKTLVGKACHAAIMQHLQTLRCYIWEDHELYFPLSHWQDCGDLY